MCVTVIIIPSLRETTTCEGRASMFAQRLWKNLTMQGKIKTDENIVAGQFSIVNGSPETFVAIHIHCCKWQHFGTDWWGLQWTKELAIPKLPNVTPKQVLS
ncbi:hypothetical protein PFLUV_G00271430 [Perca fluviatilis]|uniref:Uncharacterized protein n=1 Tax=Perca fluviatilis TaxID=8168 RepID=A0A6A5DTN7_PERFL|nr:hypothetical protein PFLUV_G00271430 [Perca fluviatilis]